ncbi:hypothetical protein JW905_06045 [bacterium]|nr:hypothetical protein [candidate division CSSED10-310 bacterium]
MNYLSSHPLVPPIATIVLCLITMSVHPAGAWSPQTVLQISSDTNNFMPTSLQTLIQDRWTDLIRGITEGTSFKTDYHELPQAIALRAGAASKLIDQRKPFSDVVYQLGFLAELIGRTTDPFRHPGVPTCDRKFVPSYERFVDDNLKHFRLIFPGFSSDVAAFSHLTHRGHASEKRAGEFVPSLINAYRERAAVDEEVTFDQRSTPFGVAYLCYLRAVEDLANAWLVIWSTSGGNLTGMKFPPPEGHS